MSQINHKELLAAVAYSKDTGIFTRLVPTGYRGCYKAGSQLGSKTAAGYLETQVGGERVYLHRLAYFYVTGAWPEETIDHIDGDRANNRWVNLRAATHVVNGQNFRSARSDSTTRLLGASYAKHAGKFVARITHKGKYLGLGYFDTAQEAHEAYLAAKRKLHEGNTL